MTGLEKMKNQILETAKAIANSKIAVANNEAQAIMEKAREEVEKEVASISNKYEVEMQNYRERMTSTADLQRRTKILEAKQSIIKSIIEKTYQSLNTMNQEEYFGLLLKLLEQYVLPQEGIMYLSERDFGRVTEEFKKGVAKIAESKGGMLTVSNTPKNIENGFVLVYGGIEENCTLKAIMDAKKDQLSDCIQKLLFS